MGAFCLALLSCYSRRGHAHRILEIADACLTLASCSRGTTRDRRCTTAKIHFLRKTRQRSRAAPQHRAGLRAGSPSLVPLPAAFSSRCDSLHRNPGREAKGISSRRFPLWAVQERTVQTSSRVRVAKQLPQLPSESPGSSLRCCRLCRHPLFFFLNNQARFKTMSSSC